MIRKNNKGITLIALVITIIVLLILAGVAISMLSGENGILRQAASAKTKTERATLEEQIKLFAGEVAIAEHDKTVTSKGGWQTKMKENFEKKMKEENIIGENDTLDFEFDKILLNGTPILEELGPIFSSKPEAAEDEVTQASNTYTLREAIDNILNSKGITEEEIYDPVDPWDWASAKPYAQENNGVITLNNDVYIYETITIENTDEEYRIIVIDLNGHNLIYNGAYNGTKVELFKDKDGYMAIYIIDSQKTGKILMSNAVPEGYEYVKEFDLNHDGVICDGDYEKIRDSFNLGEGEEGFNPECDFDGDGYVIAPDLKFWLDGIKGCYSHEAPTRNLGADLNQGGYKVPVELICRCCDEIVVAK